MNLSQYKIKDDPDLISYILDLPKDKVIYNDYFYFTGNSFITEENIYSEKQVARILNSTDKEYFELIEKYLTNTSSDQVDTAAQAERLKVQAKIDELNAKIQKSKDFEEADKKVKELKIEIEKIDKELKSYDGVHEKIQDTHNQSKQFEQLSKFNLQKIHDDLVTINAQIDRLEEELISKKIVEIKEGKEEYEFDSGKVGLAIGVMIGIGIFGAVFLVLSLPLYVSLIVWGIGLIAGLFIIFFSRAPKNVDDIQNSYYSTQDVENMLGNLKNQRQAILSLIGVKNANEFFLMKARYSSTKKNLDYLQNLKTDMGQRLNLDELRSQRDKLNADLLENSRKSADPSVLLKPDEYLSLYRELDSLKLQIGNTSTTNVTKDEIPRKLSEIRKELSDKLPSYVNVLKGTYQRSYEKIRSRFTEYTQKLGLSSKDLTNDLSEWGTLTNFEKFLIQLSMAQEVYVENFVLILEEMSLWTPEEQSIFSLFTDIFREEKFDLMRIDS